MSLKAEQLRHNKAQKVQVRVQTKAILGYVDEELRKAHDSGKADVSMTLPINFSIPFMRNNDAQRKIYSKILESLIERDFIPKLRLRKDSTLLTIRWWSDEELHDMDVQNTLIAKYSEKSYGNVDLNTKDKDQ
jgi:hypothetical protein